MLIVDVPLNTMLADLDETLRGLLKDQLERHGFEGVDIAFDAFEAMTLELVLE